MGSIKLDGYSPEHFGLRLMADHYHPMTPEVRRKTITIPGKSGEWDFGSEWGSRPFELPFKRIEQDPIEMQRKLREFVAFLLDSYGKPRPIKLVFEYEPDKYYQVKLDGMITPARLALMSEFTLPFVAHNPNALFIVPTDEITLDSDVPLLSDITLDAEYSFDFSIVNGTQSITVYNAGTLTVRPTLIFTGTADELAVSTAKAGGSFTIQPFANKTIEINGDLYTVKSGGVETLSIMTGNFIELDPGKNTVTIRGVNLNANLKIRFNYQYI